MSIPTLICLALTRSRDGGEFEALISRFHQATASLQGVNYSVRAQELTISYKARTVRVRGSDMRGVMAQETHDETLPFDTGFVVTAYVFDHRQGEPPRSFQAAGTKHGWDYADYQLVKSNKAIYFNLRWGKHADLQTLKRLYHAVELKARRLTG